MSLEGLARNAAVAITLVVLALIYFAVRLIVLEM
jgi:hypothetical protein